MCIHAISNPKTKPGKYESSRPKHSLPLPWWGWAANTHLENFRACGLEVTHPTPPESSVHHHHHSSRLIYSQMHTEGRQDPACMSSPSTKLRKHHSKLHDWSMDSRELRWSRMCTWGLRFYTAISTAPICLPGQSGNNVTPDFSPWLTWFACTICGLTASSVNTPTNFLEERDPSNQLQADTYYVV